MYSHEIERLLKIRNYVVTCSEYFEIISTSPQIKHVKYNPNDDSTTIETEDNYKFKLYIKTIQR